MPDAPTTDDEAFLRAIVDAPADEAPRLVYADWLDERGDPRGAYLRAELKWARERAYDRTPGDVIALANTLDSLWVSRVSRPPVGVCFDGHGFQDRGPELTLSDVLRVEQRLGRRLPSDYRAFLLNVNGGRPGRREIALRNGLRGIEWPLSPDRVEEFLAVRPDQQGLEAAWAAFRVGRTALFDRFIPIARLEGNAYLLLGVDDRAWCHVYRWPGPDDEGDQTLAVKLEDTLADLLDRLQMPLARIAGLIRDGDVRRLIHWLDTGGSVETYGRGSMGDLVSTAIRSRRADIVQELFHRKATLTGEAIRLANSAGDPEITELVQARWRELPDLHRMILRLGNHTPNEAG
jgi:uncharacterized protein (TIGR02996 family)